ncbi:hypothetical protein ACWEK5_42955 [Rhodococcus koreensis]
MTDGLGLSIGTKRAIAVRVTGDGTSTVSRRSTLTFGAASTVRLGDPPGAGVVAEFADRVGEVLVAGDGRSYTAQDLIAAAAYCLLAEANPPGDVPIVLTYPAVYSPGVVAALRAALDGAGLGRVGLVAEPVAALACLKSEHGPLGDGLALVYDLDEDALDLTLVAFGAPHGPDPIVGQPLRSTEFGGHRRAGAERSDVLAPSLELVADCLRVAGTAPEDVDVVVVPGDAAANPAVEDVLARLGRPVVCDPNPDSIVARGAAILAAASRTVPAPAVTPVPNPWPRRAAVASIAAAVVLALPLLFRGAEPDPVSTAAAPSAATAPGLSPRWVEQAERPRIPSRRATHESPPPPAATAGSTSAERPVEAVVPVIARPPVAVIPAALPVPADIDLPPDLDSTPTAAAVTPPVSPVAAPSIDPKPVPRPESPPRTPEPTVDPTTELPPPDPTTSPDTAPADPGLDTSEPSNP